LRRLRRAALAERKMISALDMQIELGEEEDGLVMDRFQAAMADGSAEREFVADRAMCAQYGATGFPTILIHADDNGVMANGYRTFVTYDRAIEKVAGTLKKYAPRPIKTLLSEYGHLTTRELSEITGVDVTAVNTQMETMLAAGEVDRLPVHGGEFWIWK